MRLCRSIPTTIGNSGNLDGFLTITGRRNDIRSSTWTGSIPNYIWNRWTGGTTSEGKILSSWEDINCFDTTKVLSSRLCSPSIQSTLGKSGNSLKCTRDIGIASITSESTLIGLERSTWILPIWTIGIKWRGINTRQRLVLRSWTCTMADLWSRLCWRWSSHRYL